MQCVVPTAAASVDPLATSPPIADHERAAAVARFGPHTRSNTSPFRFQNAPPWMRVVDVYDGDTVKVVLEAFPGAFVRASVRLAGIDTCEMKDARPDMRVRAVAARDRLFELLLTSGAGAPPAIITPKSIRDALAKDVHVVHATVHGTDKYGRILADLRRAPGEDESFNEALVREGLATCYNGRGAKNDAAV